MEVRERLSKFFTEETIATMARRLARLTADVPVALTHGERWLEAYVEEQGSVPDISADLDWLLPAWASGAFLPRLMVRRPWLYDRFRMSARQRHRKTPNEYLADALEQTEPLTTVADLHAALRAFKQESVFFIGVRDLAGYIQLEDVTAELSALADACIEAAYRFHFRALVSEYGEPLTASGNRSRFVVLGMGKLGGNELNFSSDIDLIYFYEEEGETQGGSAGHLINGEFFTKLAKAVTAALNDVTGDGFVFRVDLRLRPEGNNGPLVNSVAAGESYYMTWGQTWERAALIKARPVAGDLALGEAFLSAIESFVYRRHLDYSTVEDIKMMKQKIDLNLARTVREAWDVKLGAGGIREIEFVVQTLQLIHAGKQRALRTRSTLEGLQRLHDLRLLQEEDARSLADAYVFFRRLEHRLQIEHERQTQRLASTPEAHERMSRLLGYSQESAAEAVAAFTHDLEVHRAAVQSLYHKLFESAGEVLAQGVHPAILAVTEGEGSDEDRLRALASLGFADPSAALEAMSRVTASAQARHLDSKARRYLERTRPVFLSECLAAPDPDLALQHLDEFIRRVGGWRSYHSLLAENPATLKVLVRFFGTSAFLSRFFIHHPELLDELVLASYVTPLKDFDALAKGLQSALAEGAPGDYEFFLDTLRRYKNTEMLRIAINDIEGQLDLIEVTTQLADLADVVFRAALSEALRSVEARYGKAPGAELIALGMGKFGGREMNYSSDLDLIFVFTGEGTTAGERGVSFGEFFAKAVQRLISILTVATREGIAYPIDMRLRPSGNAGPLVTSLGGFEAYHSGKAAIWERQALIKARPISGSEMSARQITEILHHAVYERPLTLAERSEILRLRKRMEKEIDPESATRLNIKMGPGGIVDIEFFVQILQLQHGGEYHSLRQPNTFIALGELCELNLIARAEYNLLREAFLFLRRLENRMRIINDNAQSTLLNDPVAVEKIALSLGYTRGVSRTAAGTALLADLARVRSDVRKIFAARFADARK